MIQLSEPDLTAAIESTILDSLLPLFITGAGGDEGIARATIRDQIASYQPSSVPELLKIGRI